MQAVRADGHVQLHVRDAVASKLPPGQLVQVPAALVRPARKHVLHWPKAGGHTLDHDCCLRGLAPLVLLLCDVGGPLCHAPAGLKAVFGCNGAVWIGQGDGGCLQEQQVRAASELARMVHSSVSQGAVIKPDCMHLELT